MLYRPWRIARPEKSQIQAVAVHTGLAPLACGVLCARGKTTPAALDEMLGTGEKLSPPGLLLNMDKAVSRILAAVDSGERIAVFGDYDVDGVTATALLYTYLDSIGADVYYKLPSRDDDGYGLSENAVELMASRDVTLIITVDNGISAHAAVARAKELGVDVVVTDHHLPPAELPDAVAVVDPQLPGDKSPCKSLCGAGVAFKLAAALEGCDPEELLPFYGDLAAIGTVADIMTLEGENRHIVKAGLAALAHTDRPGLAALIRSCGFEGKALTAENISFGLSPRLNAAGRMDSAAEALELLLCEDEEEAERLAASLEDKNAARQKAEQEIAQSITEAIEADASYGADRILVVAGHGYHQGVIGIVASRIVEKYGKPAIIISVDETGEGKGSGRSIKGISLYSAIAACSDLLIRFGGHDLAAGLSVREEQIPTLRRKINEWAVKEYPVVQSPPLEIDAAVHPSRLSAESVASLDVLAPFGAGNPAPVFVVENAVIDGVYALSEGRHSRIRLRQQGAPLYAVLFGKGPEELAYHVGDAVDAAVSLSVYEGKAGPMVSARIRDLRPAGIDEAYLEPAGLCGAFFCGAQLPEEARALCCPERSDVADVYRLVRSSHVSCDDLRPVFRALGERRAGRILASLRALEQLSLIEKTPGGCYRAVANAPKRNLDDAPVLQQLRRS